MAPGNLLTTPRLILRELTPSEVAVLLDPDARSEAWIAGYPLPGSKNAATGSVGVGPATYGPVSACTTWSGPATAW